MYICIYIYINTYLYINVVISYKSISETGSVLRGPIKLSVMPELHTTANKHVDLRL